jgi:16S rRNA (uracil1498-N3)-methyltransferase
VDTILPMMTDRVVAKPYEPEKKLERWQKIALSSAEQSQRNTLPDIPAVLGLAEVIERSRGHDLKLIPTLEGDTKPLSEAIHNFSFGQIIILIGPEGDFTAQEVKMALEAGFISVSLGKNVLRVDTAAAAVAAFIKLSLPDG